jgi:UPF0716 protein FxsA
MFGLVVLALLVVPLLELFVIVQVAGHLGVLATLAALVLVSVAGTVLIRWQGLGLARRFMATVSAGRLPRSELIDGALLLFAGALLLTPGFLTDVAGLALMLPPVRAVLRPVVIAAARRMATPRPGARARVWGGVIDVDEVRAEPPGAAHALDPGPHERRSARDGR